ncbi:hypothetical protein LEP1GSC060_3057 [Leptospira weilii serovar Ranarum str. ICFT]|uniref:Uncharacterized protein n=1 Tax=Leptospira weilii serovar Ranarum str. ICFT TaxID=1218598 RepID=N1WJE6_9LEPT|nr:hypothetical protein LEP1GSC060_3057 [Leptospira weilii serovar Ranarum str. ICFT]
MFFSLRIFHTFVRSDEIFHRTFYESRIGFFLKKKLGLG